MRGGGEAVRGGRGGCEGRGEEGEGVRGGRRVRG